MREAEAALYSFNVARDHIKLGMTGLVPGTAASPNLLKLMESSTDPLAAAFQAFSTDPGYLKYCTDNKGKVNGYLAPGQDLPPTGSEGDGTDSYIPGRPAGASGGGGGGDPGGGFGGSGPSDGGGGFEIWHGYEPKRGGGYWKPLEPTPGPVTGADPEPVEQAAYAATGESVTLIGTSDPSFDCLFL